MSNPMSAPILRLSTWETDPDPIPTSVEQWYDRSSRSWVTSLRDQNGDEMDATYDGTRADAAAAKRSFEARIEVAK